LRLPVLNELARCPTGNLANCAKANRETQLLVLSGNSQNIRILQLENCHIISELRSHRILHCPPADFAQAADQFIERRDGKFFEINDNVVTATGMAASDFLLAATASPQVKPREPRRASALDRSAGKQR
jgi:hypothetical protein